MTALLAVIGTVVVAGGAFCLGWFLCSRTQSNRMSAAITVSEMGAKVAEASNAVVSSNAMVGARLGAFEAAANSAQASSAAAEQVLDRVDRSLGSILNAMVHAGMFKTTDGVPHGARSRQRGEPDSGSDVPPPLPLAHGKLR